jgi:hypothetical protein
MTKKVKVSKNKPYVIALGGIAVAICLIGWGTMFKPNNKEETTEEIKIESKKTLTENEQFELKPVSDLINAVKNRFEDEISKNRAQETSKKIIKELIEKSPIKVDDWGVFVTNITKEELSKWNEDQEEKFKIELKEMAENTEVKNVQVEEIAQNNPLYILQEKKIIQRELYEQWLLIKETNSSSSNEANSSSINEPSLNNKEVSKSEEDELKIDPSKIDPSNEKESMLGKETNTNIIQPLAITAIPAIQIDQEKEKKSNELLKVTQDLEKAKAFEKELAEKKLQLNDELTKNTQNLKGIESEIEKTNKELEKLEKELKSLQ